MDVKSYRIDFFQLNIDPSGAIARPEDAFDLMIKGQLPKSKQVGGYDREIFNLAPRQAGNSYGAQFRKFRVDHLPEIGQKGLSAHQLSLSPGQGLIEKNFIVYYRKFRILGWHLNGHANAPKQLAQFLSDIWGQKVTIEPILVADALNRLMSGSVHVTSIMASVARPTNPDVVMGDDYSDAVMNMLNGLDGDRIKIEINIDGRRADSAGRLATKAKDVIRALKRAGASTARAHVVDDEGFEYPIDLVLDRCKSSVEIPTDGQFPAAETMFEYIDAAHKEHEDDFTAAFGDGDNSLD